MTDAHDAPKTEPGLPKTRMFTLVREIEFDLFKDREAAMLKGGGGG